MNKNFLKTLVCSVLVMTLFVSCSNTGKPVETTETSTTAISEEPTVKVEEQTDTETAQISTEAVQTDTEAAQTSTEAVQTDTEAVQTSTEALICIRFPDEELLAEPQAFSEFIADDTEYEVKVELSTDIAVTNFSVLSLNLDNVSEDGAMLFSGNELYSQESLTPEKPLVVGLALVGTIPNMGISYVDADGMERVYAITLSGEDGQPLLIESELTR